jgi:hypothetical protein
MPTGKNWFNFTYANIIFIVQIIVIQQLAASHKMRTNWAMYRCNPMYMPFSNNIQQDFVYCVQNIQASFMGYLLQPLTYTISLLTNLGGNFNGNVNDTRAMFNKERNYISSAIQNTFPSLLESEQSTLKSQQQQSASQLS